MFIMPCHNEKDQVFWCGWAAYSYIHAPRLIFVVLLYNPVCIGQRHHKKGSVQRIKQRLRRQVEIFLLQMMISDSNQCCYPQLCARLVCFWFYFSSVSLSFGKGPWIKKTRSAGQLFLFVCERERETWKCTRQNVRAARMSEQFVEISAKFTT